MPSVRFRASPLGKTSTSLAVKSVSGAVDGVEDQLDGAGDFQVRSERSGGVDEHVVALLDGALIHRPQGNLLLSQQTAPPVVGTGLLGSYT